MIRVGVSGATGRMGSTLVKIIAQEQDMKLTAAIASPENPSLGVDIGEILGIGKLDVKLTSEVTENMDCLVEFSTPEATISHLHKTKEYKIPMVIGTTGFKKDEMKEIEETAKEIPIVLSPNMSLGINILFRILPDLVNLMEDYDIEIIEMHRKAKRDAPSGTALKLKEVIGKEIPIHSVRAGDIRGVHTIIFAGSAETLTITHEVHAREVFARGTLPAIRFVVKAKPGLYSMKEVLENELRIRRKGTAS